LRFFVPIDDVDDDPEKSVDLGRIKNHEIEGGAKENGPDLG
jgi:hypothetical protein